MTGPAEAREAEWHELSELLRRCTDNSLVVPCVQRHAPKRWWISDDAGEQQRAASLCLPCAALRECRAYGLAYRDEAGVYGGLTAPERKHGAPTPDFGWGRS